MASEDSTGPAWLAFGGLLLALAVLLVIAPAGDCAGPWKWALRDVFSIFGATEDRSLEHTVLAPCRSQSLARLHVALGLGLPGLVMVMIGATAGARDQARTVGENTTAAGTAARRGDGGWWVWHGAASGWRFHPDQPQ